jgi:hypothetical protein
MATYTLISSNVLASSAASVTFSSIPATYTDLVVRASARGDTASVIMNVDLNFNGVTGTSYSYTYLQGNGSAASSGRDSSQPNSYVGYVPSASATSDTFGNLEVYIPSYTASQNKPVSTISHQENNNTQGFVRAYATLFSNTSAISSITLTTPSNFVSGSSFYLYGISNA